MSADEFQLEHDGLEDDDETHGMETVTIASASVAPASLPASSASAEAEQQKQQQQNKQRQTQTQTQHHSSSCHDVPPGRTIATSTGTCSRPADADADSPAPTTQAIATATAAAAAPPGGSHPFAATDRMSPLDQTAAARSERRRIFLQRTTQTARRVWDRINPNLQLCLCQTAAKQLEAESSYTTSDRNWIQSPGGAAAATYAQTAADSIGRDFEVEVYRRFLFDDDMTYSKCEEDEDEDDGEDVGDSAVESGGNADAVVDGNRDEEVGGGVAASKS